MIFNSCVAAINKLNHMIEIDEVELNVFCLSYVYKSTTHICLNTVSSIEIGFFYDFTFPKRRERTTLRVLNTPQARVRGAPERYGYAN